MNLSHISGEYIQARRVKLMAENEASKRRERMDRYERMYRLDVYDSPRAPNEVRVSLPVAPETVEKMRALLVTRPPSITVPYNSADPEDMARGQKVEQWLYAAAHRANFQRVLFDAEWFAMCLGMGIIRYYVDLEVPEGDFPIPITAPDPRTVFGLENPARDRFVELVHTWPRKRREIENELGVTLNRPMQPLDLEAEAAWLDGEVEYTEYWLETQVKEKRSAKRQEDLLTDLVAKALQSQIMGEAGLEMEPEPEPEPVRRRVRKVIHSIIVDDTGAGVLGPQVLKRPVIMAGYHSIPYVFWSGTSTPLKGANAHLSVLFPLSNGDAGDRSMGVLAAQNLLASLDVESAIRAPNSPLWTDDPAAQIDLAPDAVNRVQPGHRVDRLQTDVTNPAVVRGLELMGDQTARHSIPSILTGDNVQSLSGQAISGFATVFQMLIGHKQVERERALEQLFGAWLCLVEEWADPVEGMQAWGYTPTGTYVDVALLPDDVQGNYRVQVKLSASMPQDQIGMISTLSMLQKQGQISMETLLDQVQKLLGLAADTPNDEIIRILRDRWIMDSQFAEQMAQLLAADYRELLLGHGQPIIPPGAMQNSQALAGSMEAMLAGAQGQPPPGGMPPEMMGGPMGPGGPPMGPVGPMPPMPPGGGGPMPMGPMPGGGAPPGVMPPALPPGVDPGMLPPM